MSDRDPKTSKTHPIRVNFVPPEKLGLSGRLGMTFAPGKKAMGIEGRWDRNLETDLRRLREHYQTDVLVSLMETHEFERFKIPDLLDRAKTLGMETLGFPIPDGGTPARSEADDFGALVSRVVEVLEQGKTVVIQCRGGLGRTGTVAASVLISLGHPPNEAIRIVRAARPGAVETRAQEDFVRRFESQVRKGRDPRRGPPHGEEPKQIDRYRGCLLGLAVGDALGTTLEFSPPDSFEPLEDMVGGGPFGLEAGQWTDDTSMALCLAESLVEKRGFDPADQLKRYVRWYREGHMSSTGELFDIGNATREALERFERTGEPYAGSTDPNRAGNGSIMRLAPVPLFYRRDPVSVFQREPVEAIERSGDSSRTTHGAPVAVDACRYLGALIAGAINGVGKDELLSERYSLAGRGYWDDYPLAEEVDEVASGSFKRKGPPEIRGRGYVVASLEAALWAFHNSDSFREGCLLAVNLGEDADTTGAVYGQLAGAYYGERDIPRSWKRKLAHRLLIEYFAERLFYSARDDQVFGRETTPGTGGKG